MTSEQANKILKEGEKVTDAAFCLLDDFERGNFSPDHLYRALIKIRQARTNINFLTREV